MDKEERQLEDYEKRSWYERLSGLSNTIKYVIVFLVLAIYLTVLLLKYFSN